MNINPQTETIEMNTQNVSYPAKQSPMKSFTDQDILTKCFNHAVDRLDGSRSVVFDNIVVMRQKENGYCECRLLNPKGVDLPMQLWSGLLTPGKLIPGTYLETINKLRSEGL